MARLEAYFQQLLMILLRFFLETEAGIRQDQAVQLKLSRGLD